jgi:hypothetical protein
LAFWLTCLTEGDGVDQNTRSLALEDAWDVLREGDRVAAAEDLPGVPAGTPGVVIETYGLWWIRYRVRFDNGEELSLLDRRRLRRWGR